MFIFNLSLVFLLFSLSLDLLDWIIIYDVCSICQEFK